MNTQQPDSLGRSIQWIQTCLPEPKSKDFHTQFGVFCEEVSEVMKEITPQNPKTASLLQDAQNAMTALSNHLKGNDSMIIVNPYNRAYFLSEMCDVIVTLTTTAHTQKMNLEGGMHAINKANFSKFENGVPLFNEDGKVIKGRDFKKANLSLFV